MLTNQIRFLCGQPAIKRRQSEQRVQFGVSGSQRTSADAWKSAEQAPQGERLKQQQAVWCAKDAEVSPVLKPKILSEHVNWVYINGLGERDSSNVTESDILSAITFDKSGEYLAVGDRGGRVIVFKYQELKNSRYFDYRYFAEIQSHEPEFDHLKSIELNEKINALEFLHHYKSSSV